ncbi:MAG TPA: ABC transporter ATP-binding protein [Woeseiaceae bacterium]|nr:ABC transporter ATP-binding protein [Woeseiaceae bacterium]|tara:strand:+ start:9350 stop:9997 length:648 start_codon:yes stop_codon:yes gene_type:complete
MNALLEINNLKHAFEKKKFVLKDINLEIYSGEIISILGPSGCGKTTLLRIIAGLEKPTDGIIKINNNIISNKQYSMPPEKRNIGLVVQERALFPHLNVLKNVTFGIQGLKERNDIALNYLKLFKVDQLKNKYPHEVSGGEQQRVALARAMAPNPNILLLDEPFNALDDELKSELHNETKKIFKEKGATVLIVSHNKEEAHFFSDRLITINNGKIS